MGKKEIQVLLLSLFFASSFGQSVKTDSSEVASAVDELYLAMVQKDQAPLHDLTAENLSYGHSSGTIENQKQFVDAVLMGKFEYLTIDTEDQRISISGETAIVRHIFLTRGVDGGKTVDVRIGNMMVFQKQGDRWKLLARQAYKL